jgi:hypothetical protein
MLLLANGIGEPQVDIFDPVVLHHFQNSGCRHYNSSKSADTKDSYTATGMAAVMSKKS